MFFSLPGEKGRFVNRPYVSSAKNKAEPTRVIEHASPAAQDRVGAVREPPRAGVTARPAQASSLCPQFINFRCDLLASYTLL
jgi:hypothetical protein